MSYFEKIGNTISSKTKELSQKAKSFSETNSLNSIIKTQNRKIEASYKMIGKLWFEKYGDSPSEEFAEAVSSIKEANRKIEEAQQQIEKIRSMNKCPNCGRTFKFDSVFCSGCGTRVKEEIPEPEILKCAVCGNNIENGMLFCDKCGTKVGDMPENTPSEPKKIIEAEVVSEEKTRKCPECGAESDDENALFCDSCGKKLTDDNK